MKQMHKRYIQPTHDEELHKLQSSIPRETDAWRHCAALRVVEIVLYNKLLQE